MLGELLSKEDCASCQICCKFEQSELFDAPTFSFEAVVYIRNSIDKNIRFNKHGNIYQIDLIKYGEKFICPLSTNQGCVLSKYKPFDCESWPYYIMKYNGKYAITLSNDCPVFNKTDGKKIYDFAKNKLLKKAKKIIKQYPNMITDYNRNLKIIYEFDVID